MVKRTKAKAGANPGVAAPGSGSISVWQGDPDEGVLIERPVPDAAKTPLAFKMDQPRPAPAVYTVGTPEFRYWTAADALRRCADFWAPRVPSGAWQPGAVLSIVLDEGEDLNAYYDRSALNFFHGQGTGGTVYSGESPDIVCHEMGHAILDAIKPQLWGAASHETAAFHEAFGDISAILSALQIDSLRNAILTETSFEIRRASRLSRLAEQLGDAIRLQAPDAVDPDCLRNAVNSFTYVDPINLPQSGPASRLSSEPHSFSRVFTAAFFDMLGGLLKAAAKDPNAPTSDELLKVTGDLADILIAAVQKAPVVSNFYSQVAAAMLEASASYSAAYTTVIRTAFVQRSILSLAAAWDLHDAQKSIAAFVQKAAAPNANEPLASTAIPGGTYGFKQPIVVEAASHNRPIIARAAAVEGIGPVEPASASTAAIAFLNDLFARDHVDCSTVGAPKGQFGRAKRSHKIVMEKGAYRLKRCHFNCGFSPW